MPTHDSSTDSVIADAAVLHLVRHGESEWNLDGRIQGQSSAAGGLTAAGRDQAARTARWLAEHAPRADLIVVSDLLRARQTAAIIADRLGLPVELDPELREQRLGAWEGAAFTAPLADSGTGQDAIDSLWREPHHRPPGGESVAEMYARVHRALRGHAARRAGRETVLVTHGGPVRMATAAAPPMPGVAMPRSPVDNASIMSITVCPEHRVNNGR